MSTDAHPRTISSAASAARQPSRILPALLERLAPGDRETDAVPRLERRVAELLGKPAAAMFPTGTMAQQVAMRIHAERRGIRTVAFHPQCHLDAHEYKGYAFVHGLNAVLVGDRYSLIQRSDLEKICEPVAALLLELPQRDLGGRLPAWEDLVAQAEWARENGVALHMDGARLWESQPFYERPHAEIAALFDTVYVSLYKGLMGIAGAMLAGEPDVVAQAAMWRDRLGGSTERSWPMAMSADRGLDERLPRMAEFVGRARELAATLEQLPGVHVVPNPPQTTMFHVHMDVPAVAFGEAVRQLTETSELPPPHYFQTTNSSQRCRFELAVNEQLDEITDLEVADYVVELMTKAREQSSVDSQAA